MEPLSALVISIGSLALKDILKKISEDSAKDFAKDLFKERLKDWSKAADKPALERAALQALKEFLRIFEEEIDSAADLTFIGDAVKGDLTKFLSDENVKALQGRPFDPGATLSARRVRFVLLLLAWLQKCTEVNGNTYAKEDSAVGVSHSWTGREDLSCGHTSCVVQEQWKAIKSANLIIRQIIRIVLVVRKDGRIGSHYLSSSAPKSRCRFIDRRQRISHQQRKILVNSVAAPNNESSERLIRSWRKP